ncbi:MAG TPA: hypothetical protein VJV78_05655 [Polyangiales bacterium]|nr:hypothetical protein [Polyangiales bacterium]
MNIRSLASASIVLCMLGCSESTAPQLPAAAPPPVGGQASVEEPVSQPAATAPNPRANFVLPPLEPGYQRFVATPVPVPAGTSDDWMQWVGGPTEQDYDVSMIKGAQSFTGHHAIMLTTSEAHPAGFTRLWNERDQLTSSSVGGIGAEGAIPLPEGVAIRVEKGTYFVIQTHYLNATDKDAMGETYVDLQLSPPDPAHILAGHFASTSIALSLPPHARTSVEVNCNTERDLSILRMTNHMHAYGVNVFTEVVDPTGNTQMLKRDDAWSEHWALAPNYDYFTIDQPRVIRAGSTVRTRCNFDNPTDAAITFPTEMCVFATLILGDIEITCIEGKFAVSKTEAATPVAGSGGSAAVPPSGGAGASGAAAPTTAGGCTGTSDRTVLEGPNFEQILKTCGVQCLAGADSCAAQCLTMRSTLSPACAACNGTRLTCAMAHCIGDCAADFMSTGCNSCIETNCGAAYHPCSGL